MLVGVVFVMASESLPMIILVVVAFLCLGLTAHGSEASALMRTSSSWWVFPHQGPAHIVATEEDTRAAARDAMRALRDDEHDWT